jgi:hypothetical protein
MNSKDSPEWFKIIPEWKRTQFKEYLAKNEDSIRVISKHNGWISISPKTNTIFSIKVSLIIFLII